ncbi:ubiquitin carboxyl-terminal hydrolase, partial [Tanacetum coccineum]
DVKQKNGERRTRRALGDIGNLVPARHWHSLVSNAQKPKAEVGEAALKKLTLDSVKRRSIKPPKSLTTVLSATQQDPVVNIDASDMLAETEYRLETFTVFISSQKTKVAWGLIQTKDPVVNIDVINHHHNEFGLRLSCLNFKAQLVANAQKPKAEVGEAALKNLTLDSVKRRSIKPPKSLTAVLSARSKVACGITARPKDPMVNIDASDINNELAETEYVEDIYKFYKLSETEGGLRDYMDSQHDINAKMRAILVDWIIEVHKKFDLMRETLYLTINIVDRYLSVSPVPRRELQLLGISALLISSKYEEIWPPEVNDLIHISDSAYTREQILAMEKAILGQLGWYMTVPTPYVFTVRYTKASIPSDNNEMENMVFFYTELGLMDYTVIISNNPSKLAASAVYAARCTLKKTPAWTETLKHHTGYSEDQVRDCAKSLVNLHACASESRLKAVCRKYEDPERGAVALFPPAGSLVAVVVLMAPKRSFYPIFLIVSLSALFVFSVYHSSSISLSSSPPITHFPLPIQKLPTLQNSPKFSFTIKVLTYDRLASLTRCLKSLSAAHYDNEKVNLHIYVDHFKVLDQTGEDLDKKLNESRMILDFVDGFEWRYGEKMVHYRTGNVGLQAQWLEAWWPSSDNEFAFVVEDDIELSPLYYRFLKGLIVEYYYNASNYSPWVYGASLQRPRFVPGKHGNKIQLNEETQVFLYQLVGTWGQLLFPRPWKEFRLWYDTHKTKGMKPILDGMVTTGWYKKMGDRIWTPWFIKFVHARGYFNMYSHFSHEAALSVSHRDVMGVNYWKTAWPDSNLIQEMFLPIANFFKLEPLIISSSHYSNSLLDLSRRGHPVINVDRLFDSIEEFKRISFRKEIVVKAYVTKKALEMESSGSGIWNNHFVNEIARMPESNLSNEEDGFGFWAGKLLEKKGVKLQRVNEARFGVEIDTSDDNRNSLKNDTKLAFWSSNMGSELVKSRLERLGLWIIDAESICMAVICHPS